jgi:hypothetical protein
MENARVLRAATAALAPIPLQSLLRTSARVCAVAALVTLSCALSSCSGSAKQSQSIPSVASSPLATRSSIAVTPAASSSSAPASRVYTAKSFAIPLTVTVPIPLDVVPTMDGGNFITWESSYFDDKIRIMVPVIVYAPGQADAEAPPADFLTYLRGLTKAGAVESDEKQTTVAGHPTTLITFDPLPNETVETALEGSFGCPDSGIPKSDDACYSPSSDLTLRVAVTNVNGKTLLIWARVDKYATETATFFTDFETMLAGLKLD